MNLNFLTNIIMFLIYLTFQRSLLIIDKAIKIIELLRWDVPLFILFAHLYFTLLYNNNKVNVTLILLFQFHLKKAFCLLSVERDTILHIIIIVIALNNLKSVTHGEFIFHQTFTVCLCAHMTKWGDIIRSMQTL